MADECGTTLLGCKEVLNDRLKRAIRYVIKSSAHVILDTMQALPLFSVQLTLKKAG